MENKPASAPQRWAIFVKTGYDVRGCVLTNEDAKTILDKSDADAIAFMANVAGAIKKTNKTPKQDWESVWNEAHKAGMIAGQGVTPVPMIVGSPSTPLGNDIDPTKKTYFVPDGCCGFAWVVVYPGNHSFANWAKKTHDARAEYGGGCCVKWVHEFNQSMTRKEQYAQAFAEVLRKHDIKAYAKSRMD